MNYLKWLMPVIFVAAACNTDPDVVVPSTVGLSVYPNPATDAVTISISLEIENRGEVYDSNGDMFSSWRRDSDGYSIVDLTNRPSGVYQVIVTTDRETLTREFIKL